jgi:hypothetical protein
MGRRGDRGLREVTQPGVAHPLRGWCLQRVGLLTWVLVLISSSGHGRYGGIKKQDAKDLKSKEGKHKVKGPTLCSRRTKDGPPKG